MQALLAAAAEADLRAVEELLRRPLDPDVVDRRGKTALCASRKKRDEAIDVYMIVYVYI